MNGCTLAELDIIFLSYDEPNCEANYAHLLDIAPWAKRVHGVHGFDAAHKACAAASTTEWFITVDGDNTIDPEFLDLVIPDWYDGTTVISWTSVNSVNGLVYGNGGLKLWPKQLVEQMATHENSVDGNHALDFCWNDNYVQMTGCFSTTNIHGSAFQAFRAGYREGIKMNLNNGVRVPADKWDTIYELNRKRILQWMSVGDDVPNGKWAVLGARWGFLAGFDPQQDIDWIRDYTQFKALWDSISDRDPYVLSHTIEQEIVDIVGHKVPMFTPESSNFIKLIGTQPSKKGWERE